MRLSRVLSLAVPAAVLATAVPASALPVELRFDHAVLDVPAAPKQVVIAAGQTPLSLTADVNILTGAFTVAPADFRFPTVQLTKPAPVTLRVTLAEPASGRVDYASGTVTMTSRLVSTLTVPGVGDCAITGAPVTLSTGATAPLPGQAFPAGVTGAINGSGAVAGTWPTLPAGTGPACGVVDPLVAGPGGVWLSRGIEPPAQPKVAALAVSARAPQAIRRGRTGTLVATVVSSGDGDADGVVVCVQPATAKRKTCTTVGPLAAGASRALRFRIGIPARTTRRTVAVRVRATASGVATVARSVAVRVRR